MPLFHRDMLLGDLIGQPEVHQNSCLARKQHDNPQIGRPDQPCAISLLIADRLYLPKQLWPHHPMMESIISPSLTWLGQKDVAGRKKWRSRCHCQALKLTRGGKCEQPWVSAQLTEYYKVKWKESKRTIHKVDFEHCTSGQSTDSTRLYRGTTSARHNSAS